MSLRLECRAKTAVFANTKEKKSECGLGSPFSSSRFPLTWNHSFFLIPATVLDRLLPTTTLRANAPQGRCGLHVM